LNDHALGEEGAYVALGSNFNLFPLGDNHALKEEGA